MHWTDFTIKVLETFFVHAPKVIAWPLAAVAIAFVFRVELRGFLSRATKIGLKGAEAIPPQLQAQATAITSSTTEATVQDSDAPTTKFVAQREQFLRTELIRLGWDKFSKDDLNKRLLRELALEQTRGHFRIIEKIIFGSQVALLEELHQKGPLKYTEVRPFYDRYLTLSADSGQAGGSFDEWIRYLFVTELVETDQGIYKLTDLGSDFTTFFAPTVRSALLSRPL